MQPRERNAFVFLCVLTALLLGLLVPAYEWAKPPRSTSVMIAVKFVQIDETFLDSIGVQFSAPPADVGTQ